MTTDAKIVERVIEDLEGLEVSEVEDQLTSILAKYQVPPEKQVKMLMQTGRQIKETVAAVKASDKDAATKWIKLSVVVSDYVSRLKQGNNAAAASGRGGRKAKNNAATNINSYFEDIEPEVKKKNNTPVSWSDSELTEIKAEDEIVKSEPVKQDEEEGEEAFLEELLDDEEDPVEEEFIKEELIKEEEIKTEPYKEEEVVAAVKTTAKRGRTTAAKPAPSRAPRSTRVRAPEVFTIDSSSDESTPVAPEPVAPEPVAKKPGPKKRAAPSSPKKRGAPAKPAKRAKAAKKAPLAPPVEEEPVPELIPEAYLKEEEEEDEDMPELDNPGDEQASPTKEKPVGKVKPQVRQQKKSTKPTVPADDSDSDDEEMGDNVIVNFTKENTPTFENQYSHIVLADKPGNGMYPDDATPPSITEVLALDSCKIVQKPDMSLFEMLQLVHSPEGQYLVVSMVDEAKLKQKKYHLLIPGVINDGTIIKEIS